MADIPVKIRCPGCGSYRHVQIRCTNGPHHGKLVCSECGHFIRWVSAPMTPERAASFRMPFGQYMGKSLSRIASKREGRRYLSSFIDQGQATGKMVTAIQLVLEQRSAKASHLPGAAGPPPDERKAEPALQNSANQTQKKKRRSWAS